MTVRCSTCGRYFDDEFRLTYCPHDTFAANDGNNNFAHHPEALLTRPFRKPKREDFNDCGAPHLDESGE